MIKEAEDIVTFFTHVRSFDGLIGDIQWAAINSWKYAYPRTNVVLYYPDNSQKHVADALDISYSISKVTKFGCPDLHHLFKTTEQEHPSDWYCEVSSDIIFTSFIPLIDRLVSFDRPFVVGQRLDYDPDELTYTLHPPSAVDWFLYRRNTLPYEDIPSFNVGRTAYDNWLVWAAIERWNLTALDATGIVTAVHHKHPYEEHDTRALMLESDARNHNLSLVTSTGCQYWAGVHHAERLQL